MRKIVAGVLIVIVLFGLLLYSQRIRGPFHVSGFIEADEVRVGSRVGGRVLRVHVDEGQRVPDDGVLFELEPFDLKEQRAEAAAILAERRAELDRLVAGYRSEEIAQAQARVEQLKANLEKLRNGPRPEEIEAAAKEAKEAEERYRLADLKYKRAEQLLGRGAITQDEFDRISSEVRAARATWEARQARHRLLQKGTREEDIRQAVAQLKEATAALQLLQNGYRSEQIARARAAVEAAEASLRAIDRRIEELTVKGRPGLIVQAIDLHPGDLVGANVPAVSLLDPRTLRVRAYVPENRLNIQVGDRVWVRVDSFPGERFAGRITFISQEAEFTPRNVQTPEERSKQVFRIKVTLEEGHGRLRPGMSADVFFEDGEQAAEADAVSRARP
ncbi:MAG: HlyD family efflux transporter periplasmic adaptor subunit [Planctomycetes bacterium]|nr:HlyD family efflux transporter periplasmic adaptor subunit [Planctomycetota bacterium]